MAGYFPVYIYFLFVGAVTLIVLIACLLFPPQKSSPLKYMPYESGIRTETELLQKRVPLRYYLVALLFLVFDVEIIFMYPWAVIAKKIGPFAFYEMFFFFLFLMMGYFYIWKKGGLEWE